MDVFSQINSNYSKDQASQPDVFGQISSTYGATPQAPQSDVFSQIKDNYSGGTQTVDKAEGYLDNQSFNNLCEKFAEKIATDKTGQFGSASQAWDHFVKIGQAKSDVKNAQKGNLIYFSANEGNGNNGHVGISIGNGHMISATPNGVKVSNIADWEKSTGQTALGFVAPQK